MSDGTGDDRGGREQVPEPGRQHVAAVLSYRILRIVRPGRGAGTGSDDGGDDRPGWKGLLLRVIAYSFFITAVVSPFALGDLVSQYSRILTNRILGPAYPPAGNVARRDQVTVALVSDDTLKKLRAAGEDISWPPSYRFHADVLFEILQHKPAAVMVDLLFVDPRNDDTIDDLVEVIQAYKDDTNKVRLFLAAPPAGSKLSPIPEIEKAVREDPSDNVKFVDVRLLRSAAPDGTGLGVTGVRPMESALRYRRDGAISQLDQFGQYGAYPTPTAAYALTQALRTDPSALPPAIEIFWGTQPDQRTAKWWPCRPISTFIPWRLVEALFAPSSLKQTCPYIPSFDVVEILSNEPDAEADTLIRDRAVFYGGDVLAAADRVETPTNFLLPAVYVHAMALDNLLTLQHEYYRDGLGNLPSFWSESIFNFVLSMIAVFVVLMYLRYATLWKDVVGFVGVLKFFGGVAFLYFIVALIIFAGALWAIFYARYLTVNWLGLLGLFAPIIGFAEFDLTEHLVNLFGGKRPDRAAR